MLGLDLSFDHAAIDGAQAARFVQILTEILHDPEAVLASEENGSRAASE
jgi:pyruvate/2-oxoglutarate dehydrogenase complex dihydrolipoamide acyltransferase (E2) component